jgi:hypothetical protein
MWTHQNAFTPSKTRDLTQPNGRHGTAGTPDEPTVPRVSIARRFYWLAKAWIAGDAKGRARGWLAALLGLSIAVGASQVLISYAARDFVTALSQRDEAAFWRNLWRYPRHVRARDPDRAPSTSSRPTASRSPGAIG